MEFNGASGDPPGSYHNSNDSNQNSKGARSCFLLQSTGEVLSAVCRRRSTLVSVQIKPFLRFYRDVHKKAVSVLGEEVVRALLPGRFTLRCGLYGLGV